MTKVQSIRLVLSLLLLLTTARPGWTSAQSADAKAPEFADVYGLVKAHLPGATEAKLNRAAVDGFLAQLQSQVSLVSNTPAGTDLSAIPLVSRTLIFDGGYGFVRIGRVGSGLAAEVGKACGQLNATNKLKGLVIDLRYAVGNDYAAAANTADLFFKTEEPLLQWGGTTARSTVKTNAVDVPLVVLINHDTAGAAEALAAALHQTERTLIIGSPSAGQAHLFEEYPLQNGQTLRVASGPVAAGTGSPLPANGIDPDIRIAVRPEEEKGYFEDPYKVFARPFAQAAKPSTNELAGGPGNSRSRRRLNEAELVRMQRDGMDFDLEGLQPAAVQTAGPILTDPALSRGLDLLKGLALAYKRR